MGPDRLGEVSVERFARDLGRMAALQPAGFALLALRMPVDCDPRYPVAILQSLAGREPPTGTPDDPCREEVTVAQIEAIIRRFAALEGDREFAISVCRAMRERISAAKADGESATDRFWQIGHCRSFATSRTRGSVFGSTTA